MIAYYTAWSTYGRNFQVRDIDAQQITHINYAFANLSNGQCVLGDPYADIDKYFPGDSWDTPNRGNFNQLRILKTKYPHLRTLISVGGWTWSKDFSEAASTQANREKLARSCVDFMEMHGFDGIDIDWEYPVSGGLQPGRSEDKANYTLLLQEFRKQLNTRSKRDGEKYILTIAAPAGPKVIQNLQIKPITEYVDWINLMAYDYNGAWDPVTGHNAPLYRSKADNGPEEYDINSAVNSYLKTGMNPKQLTVGLPLYGRAWSDTQPGVTGTGLHSKAGGPAKGTWEPGVIDYDDIQANYLPNMTYHWDAEARVPYLYSPTTRTWISYDNARSIRIKAKYVDSKQLGGVMAWELSSDRRNFLLNQLNKRFYLLSEEE